MVDKYEVSPDKTLWTFTLRDGLEWHDGKPVTSEDCIASIKRWGARDPMGQKLMDFVEGDARRSTPRPSDACSRSRTAWCSTRSASRRSNVPFMMPKTVAETDPFKQIDSQIGSGPFIYVNAESKPGEKHVYIKNPKYKPRSEPASGLAGGKVVKVDRRRDHRDARPAAAGERADRRRDRPDRAAAARPDPDPEEATRACRLVDWNPLGQQFIIRFNHLVKPFDNPKIRLAALLCDAPGGLSQGDGRRARILQGLLRRLRLRHAQRRRRAQRHCWSSRTSRSPRRCSRRPATTARRSC